MKASRYMPKIRTFDGAGFWNDAYAHQRARLLRLVKIPEDRITELVNKRYQQLPASLKYKIETGGITRRDLQ